MRSFMHFMHLLFTQRPAENWGTKAEFNSGQESWPPRSERIQPLDYKFRIQ
jgi:hypothetical protein